MRDRATKINGKEETELKKRDWNRRDERKVSSKVYETRRKRISSRDRVVIEFPRDPG